MTGFESNKTILTEMGERLKQSRIAAGMTQKELAHKSGISLRTVSSMENGEEVRTGSLLNALRALGMLHLLDAALPEQGMQPIDYRRLGKQRERVRNYASAMHTDGWKWGDEQ